MKKNTIYYIALAILSVTACSKAGTDEVAESMPAAISFGAEAGDGTRAAGETEDIAIDGYAFGVFAYDTGHYPYSDSNLNPNFMYNEKVTYSSSTGRWDYSPIKYWPNGEGEAAGNTGSRPDMLSFFAYAPHSDMQPTNAAGVCIPTISDQFEVGNPWVVYRIHDDVSQQVDLLYAAGVLDKVKPDITSRIQFGFRHALACVGEQVRVNCGSGVQRELDQDVTDNGGSARVILKDVAVTYTLTERAKLILWNTGTARWTAVLNGEPTTERTVAYGSSLSHVLYDTASGTSSIWSSPESMGVFYIPLDIPGFPQTATISVRYTVERTIDGETTETEQTRESSFHLSRYPESFAPGKKLSNLSLTIN